MTAWLSEDDLHEEFNSYLKAEYGDSDGDFSIEDSYLNVVDIVSETGHYDDMFDTWRERQIENDNLHEHPQQAMWTRDADLAEYADQHPEIEEVTEWDSVDEAPAPAEFSESNEAYVNKPGDQWHGTLVRILEVDESDDTYLILPTDDDNRDNADWYDWEQVQAEDPNAGQTPAPPAPTVVAETSEYPGLDDPYPLDVSRLPFKVGDPVISINHGVVGTGVLGTVESIDAGDRNYTYYVRWENGDGHYARRSDLRPDPGGEERAAAAKAAVLAAKLERTREYLNDRRGASDEGWQQSIDTCFNAFQPYGVTRDMVQTIADALRPPKSHAATITL